MANECRSSNTSDNSASAINPPTRNGFSYDPTLWENGPPDTMKEPDKIKVNTYILQCEETYQYRQDDLQDDDLWEQFGLDFEGWMSRFKDVKADSICNS
ncbi:hypothetical protein K3495_g6650 [Podosphaera aphanis]|nr:hypothetical protein K3495_g6650 [Podosphaera aphanis]